MTAYNVSRAPKCSFNIIGRRSNLIYSYKKLFSKKIVLKDTGEMKKMVKKIFKGMKNKKNPESHPDFYPENSLMLDNKEVFSTYRMNTGFYKLLDKLLNEKHYDFEDRIIRREL